MSVPSASYVTHPTHVHFYSAVLYIGLFHGMTLNMFCIKASAAACFEMKCNLLLYPAMTQSAHFAYLQVQSHFFRPLVLMEISPLAVMVVVNFLTQTNFVWSFSSRQQNAAAAVKIGADASKVKVLILMITPI